MGGCCAPPVRPWIMLATSTTTPNLGVHRAHSWLYMFRAHIQYGPFMVWLMVWLLSADSMAVDSHRHLNVVTWISRMVVN